MLIKRHLFYVDKIMPNRWWAPRTSPDHLCPNMRQFWMSGDPHLSSGKIILKDAFDSYLIVVDVATIIKSTVVIFYSLIVSQLHVCSHILFKIVMFIVHEIIIRTSYFEINTDSQEDAKKYTKASMQ